jgi:hypothetical protein
MPQPTVPRPAADRSSPEPEPAAPPAKGADLTVNKVLAGAGAAVTSAVLGSYFGATGTVAGAAFGSVASTVATTLYQRSLDRTRDTIVARVRLGTGRRTDLSEAPTVQLRVPQPRVSPDAATTRLRVEPALRRPRRIWLWAGATVLVFVVGLLTVTGLEWAKGSSLTTGQPGTSVGRVLTPASGGRHESDRNTTESDSEKATPSAEPTEEPAPTAEATPSAEPSETPTPTEGPDASAGPTAPAKENDRRSSATPLPTPESPAPATPRNR